MERVNLLADPVVYNHPSLKSRHPLIASQSPLWLSCTTYVTVCSSRKDLDNPIAAGAHDQPAVLTPADAAHALATHGAVADNVLGADALLERPEADAGVMAGGDGLAPVLGQAERGDGRRVR